MVKKNYNLWIGILVFCLIVLVSLIVWLEDRTIVKPTMEEQEILAFQKCANKTGLVLYGRTNSQIFLAQKEELGKLFESIKFVDCLNERESCVGIFLVPAWKINDQGYYGSFSKDVLIKLMECE